MFTAKKIIRNKTELSVLFRKLKEKGYKWSSGVDLDGSFDAERCFNNFPVLLAFDARRKVVYYSTYLDIEIPLDSDFV